MSGAVHPRFDRLLGGLVLNREVFADGSVRKPVFLKDSETAGAVGARVSVGNGVFPGADVRKLG